MNRNQRREDEKKEKKAPGSTADYYANTVPYHVARESDGGRVEPPVLFPEIDSRVTWYRRDDTGNSCTYSYIPRTGPTLTIPIAGYGPPLVPKVDVVDKDGDPLDPSKEYTECFVRVSGDTVVPAKLGGP